MKGRTIAIKLVVLIVLFAGLLGVQSSPHTLAAAPQPSPADLRPQAELLNPDGSLNLASGSRGALDPSGSRMAFAPERAPLFKPTAPLVPSNSWHALGSGLNSAVAALAMEGSNVYVGGFFTDAGGDPNADYIARWDGTAWNALGDGLNGWVEILAVEGSNVYVGGQFTDAGGDPNADHIALWDGSAWHALGSGLNNDIYAIAVDGANVFVGGWFTDAGGDANADYLARWDGTAWNALGGGLNNMVWTLAVEGSNIYVGGQFTDAGGDPNADHIARWDGSAWHALGGGLNYYVFALVMEGSNVYVGGWFTDAGGDPNADYIAGWDGSAWYTLGNGLNSWVMALAVEGSNVIVGGEFTDAGGDPNADYIARWDGVAWHALGSGLNNVVYAIAKDGSNVFVGGWFTDAGGNADADHIARWGTDYYPSGVYLEPPAQTNQGSPGQVVAHSVQLTNATGATDSFTLTLGSSAWDTSLSTDQVGPIADGETVTFTIYVTIPVNADWYTTDSVVVTATSTNNPTDFTDTAQITTEAYAPPQIGVSPESLSSTQEVGEVTTQTLTISNGNGVPLTFNIASMDLSKLMLWNKLGSDEEITHSEIGENGTIVGTSYAYEPGKFGDGYVRKDVGQNYIAFPASILDPLTERGTIELWINPKVPQPVPFEYGDWGLIGNPYGHFGVPDVFNIGVIWGEEPGEKGFVGLVRFDENGVGTPGEPTQFVATPFEPFHVAISWDIEGIDGSADTVRVYRDGEIVSSTTAAWNPNGTERYDIILGYIPDGNGFDKHIVDNIKIWDYAKTDFSDRFIESPFELSAPWLSVEPASGTVDGNSSQEITVTFDATGLQPDTYTATISILSNDPARPVVNVPVTMTVVAGQSDLSLLPEFQQENGQPGETLVYTYTLTNLGNTVDEFSLQAAGLWSTKLSANTTGMLDPSESFIFTLEVIIPADAQIGDADIALITASSMLDPLVTATAKARSTYGIKLSLPLVFKQ